MNNLFNLREGFQSPVVVGSDWEYVRAGLKRNLVSVLNYYRKNPTSVKSDNFVVRLLQSLPISRTLPLYSYYEATRGQALNLSMALGMTSSISTGRVWQGVFYGPCSHEVLIATDEDFDYEYAHTHWMNLAPIRVLRHPRTDLSLRLLDGSRPVGEVGLAVLTVNIPMLAVQYRAFKEWTAQNALIEGSTEYTIQQFVRMFVIPNMLFSHLDYAIFNRAAALLESKPLSTYIKAHSFPTVDYSAKTDEYLQKVLLRISHVQLGFTGILRNTPAITRKDQDEVMEVPRVAPTRQVHWALTVARSPALRFLLKAGQLTTNQQELNSLRRTILSYRSNDIIKSVLPSYLAYKVQTELDDITALMKS